VHTTQFRHQTRPPPAKTGLCLLGTSVAPANHAWIWQVEDTVRRTIALTIAGLFLGTAALGADHQRKPQKHQDSARPIVSGDHGGDSAVAVSVSWGTRDIEMIRRHYAPRYRNLPPGLQKKYARTGQLPPGWQKKIAPFPVSLERECAPLPAGYRRGVIDAQAVIYNSRGTIIDVVVLF
jgi:hypothetical protein